MDEWISLPLSAMLEQRTPPTPTILRFLSCTRAFQETDGWLFPTLPCGTAVPPTPQSALTSCGTCCWSPKPRKPSVPGKAPMSCCCFLHLHSPSGPKQRALMSTARGCFFHYGRILTKVHHFVELFCESSLLVWERAHTHSHPRAETPVTFLSQSSGPELPCAPEFFQVLVKPPFLFLSLGQGLGLRGEIIVRRGGRLDSIRSPEWGKIHHISTSTLRH